MPPILLQENLSLPVQTTFSTFKTGWILVNQNVQKDGSIQNDPSNEMGEIQQLETQSSDMKVDLAKKTRNMTIKEKNRGMVVFSSFKNSKKHPFSALYTTFFYGFFSFHDVFPCSTLLPQQCIAHIFSNLKRIFPTIQENQIKTD